MQSQQNEMTEEVEVAQVVLADKKSFAFGVVGLILIVTVVVGINLLNSKSLVEVKEAQSSVIPMQASEPSPKPMRKAVFAVFNGSGVAGAAGKLANKITEAGYDVLITSNYEKVIEGNIIEINVQLDEREKVMALLKRLGFDGEVKESLEDLEYSVKIIIGK